MRVALRAWALCLLLFIVAAEVRAQCTGDCDENGAVAINELVIGVNIVLETQEVGRCTSFDVNGSGGVEINELVVGVNNLLGECTCPEGVCCFYKVIEESNLTLCSTLFPEGCSDPFGISGQVRVDCGETGPGGSRECTCELLHFGAVNLPGIGVVCVDPAEGCPTGVQDCDGGDPLGVDLAASATIGSCTGNEDCAAQCDTYCEGLNKLQFDSGCDSFCKGGERDGMACECDTVGSTTCGAGTTDCPAGSCVGKDLEAVGDPTSDCQCQCVDEASGTASAAGGFRCRLGVAIRVERPSTPEGICDGEGVLVRLPSQCAPFTTETHGGLLTNANENPTKGQVDEIGPVELTGSGISCEAGDSGDLGGLNLVTNLAFFDSTIGDLVSQLTVDCR